MRLGAIVRIYTLRGFESARRSHNQLGLAYQIAFIRLTGRAPGQQPFCEAKGLAYKFARFWALPLWVEGSRRYRQLARRDRRLCRVCRAPGAVSWSIANGFWPATAGPRTFPPL